MPGLAEKREAGWVREWWQGWQNLILMVRRVGDGLYGGFARLSVRDLPNSSRQMDMKNKAVSMGCVKEAWHLNVPRFSSELKIGREVVVASGKSGSRLEYGRRTA